MKVDCMIKAGIDQARKELRFMGLSTLGAMVVGLFLLAPIQRAYDEHFRPRPFVTALVELVASGVAAPDVRYAARADAKVTGRWSAWVSVDGKRGCGGSGESGYGPPAHAPNLWLWADWLGRDCPVPDRPFAVCVRYSIETQNGIGDIAGPFCSETFDPRGMP